MAEGATATVAGSTAKDMSRRGQYSELTFSSLYQNQPGSYLKPKTSLPAPSSEAKVTLTQPLDYNLASDDDKSSVDWPEVARVYRLYNLRSSRDLLIQDDKVSATGTNADEKGDSFLLNEIFYYSFKQLNSICVACVRIFFVYIITADKFLG